MYPGMPSWAPDLLRNSHVQAGVVYARYQGAILALPDDGSVVVADRTILPLVDGTVTVDGSTAGPRRTLNVTFAPAPGLFDLLSPIGVELLPYVLLRTLGGDQVLIPQGVFPVDSEKVGYASNGDIEVTAPDRWNTVVNARLLVPRQVGGSLIRATIANLMTEVLPVGTTVTDTGTTAATVPVQTVERDRGSFIQQLCTAGGLDVYLDRTGNVVIRDVPVLNPAGAVWAVDAADDGVMVDASRERNRQRTYNMVVVEAQAADGSTPFDPVIVWDNDPTSPTYAGTGSGVALSATSLPAPSTAGPFGQRPIFYSSPLIANSGQATGAGQSLLAKVKGLAAQLTLTALPHPGLDDGDTITALMPPERHDLPAPLEVHIVDGFTVPLAPSKGNAQSITTRSTRPDDTTDS